MSEDDIILCPTCGALPCDQTQQPKDIRVEINAPGTYRVYQKEVDGEIVWVIQQVISNG